MLGDQKDVASRRFPEIADEKRDWCDRTEYTLSQFFGYAALAAAVLAGGYLLF